MEIIEHKLVDVLSKLDEQDSIIILTDSKKIKRGGKVYVQRTNSDKHYSVGLELSAIFVDINHAERYDLGLLQYLLSRVRHNLSAKFPDKVYFVSDYTGNGDFRFYGEINIE